MNIKNAKIGMIGSAVCAVVLCASAIVAECRRHRTKKKLEETQMELAVGNFVDLLKDAKIKILEEEIQDLKSNCKEKES